VRFGAALSLEVVEAPPRSASVSLGSKARITKENEDKAPDQD
jgi:hypothetical protein